MRLLLLLNCLLFGLGAYAQHGLPKKFAAIKPGTSEADVIKQVGEPKRIESFSTVRNQTFDTSYYWRYENDITIVFTNHAVEVIEPRWENVLKRIQQRANRKDENGISIIQGG